MSNKTKIHLPVSYYKNEVRKNVKIEPNIPVIFLAGPIRNAPKWQEEAIIIFVRENRELFIASPRREISPGLIEFTEKDDPTNYKTFERQRAWEQYYLYSASEKGCIIFYLPKEAEKEDPNKVYGHITMMELGEWIARCKTNPEINLVIGTDGSFPEWSTIEYEIKTEIPGIPICNSLEETIETAIKVCLTKNLIQ